MIKLVENTNSECKYDFVLGINKIYPDYTHVSRKYNGQRVYYYYTNLYEIKQLKDKNGCISVMSKPNEIIECYGDYDKNYYGKRCVIAFTLNDESKDCIKHMGGGTYFLNANINKDDIVFIDMYVYKNGYGYGQTLSEYTGLVKEYGVKHVCDITKQEFDQLIDIDKVIESMQKEVLL